MVQQSWVRENITRGKSGGALDLGEIKKPNRGCTREFAVK